ncbi:MAG: hypothetical protein ABIO88_09745 [Burkholderiaceae bacterium]
MTNLQINHWSEALRQQTRDAITQMPVTQDGRIHFKHPKLGYAYATLDDLMQERLTLQAQTSTESIQFKSVEALLQAGWAVD